MLSLAKKNPRTEKEAANLQLALLNTCVRELKDPTEVSKLLNAGTFDILVQMYTRKHNWVVNSAGDKLFDKPQLETWLKYVEVRHGETRKRNGNGAAQWVDEQSEAPHVVFELLNLNMAGDDVLASTLKSPIGRFLAERTR
ncbi:hypothetical protein PHYSODRAFT_335544 [Phytophthora sojae]|uniref:Uncharacterized protein n=1 Tax=Phytophthora sojae (strain P6497) TaxID=1094619 RepID=G4ZRD0_PHYSP|nr:hypothetical protein PHYSODRAFT_335544 [Phytophthora sojae]EGZ13815.1 hypothetical protein PHYSODRAFT_335544 [Phytophthora sojae]|eukprot:XP_009531244.1 hypothetical protein PHYSODRAFT_335544 [Phytophthora sojae]